jgi:hypothetical protein
MTAKRVIRICKLKDRQHNGQKNIQEINIRLSKAHFKCKFILNDAKNQNVLAETCLYEAVGSLPVMLAETCFYEAVGSLQLHRNMFLPT